MLYFSLFCRMARGIYHGPFWHGLGLGSKGECPSCHLKYPPACRKSRSKRGCPPPCKADKRAGGEIAGAWQGPGALLQALPTAAELPPRSGERCEPCDGRARPRERGRAAMHGNHGPCQLTRKVLGSSYRFKVPSLLTPRSFKSHERWPVPMQVCAVGL